MRIDRRALSLIALCIAGCGGVSCPVLAPVPLSAGDVELGVPGTHAIVAGSAIFRWALFRQAREDTDGNGVLQVRAGGHGGWHGDRMDRWLVLRSGRQMRIDRVGGFSADRRHLAVVRDGRAVLIDTRDEDEVDLGEVSIPYPFEYMDDGPEVVFETGDPQRLVALVGERAPIRVFDLAGRPVSDHQPSGFPIRVDAEHGWLVVYAIDQAPAAPERRDSWPLQPRYPVTSSLTGMCWRSRCEGAAIHREVHHIGSTRPPLAIGADAELEPRAWGLVIEEVDSIRWITPTGSSHEIASGCAPDSLLAVDPRLPMVAHRCHGSTDVVDLQTSQRREPTPVELDDIAAFVRRVRGDAMSFWRSRAASPSAEHAEPTFTVFDLSTATSYELRGALIGLDGALETGDVVFFWDAAAARWVRIEGGARVMDPYGEGPTVTRSWLPKEAWRFRVPMEVGRSSVFTFGPDGVGLISRFAEDGGLQCSNGYPAYPAPRLVWGRVELPEPAAVSYPADEVPGPL